jgi:hypothetical protein
MKIAAQCSEVEKKKDGSQSLKSSAPTSGLSILNTGRESWIASQRDSLARILALLEAGQGLRGKNQVLYGRFLELSTQSTLDSFFWKTARESEPEGDAKLLKLWKIGGISHGTGRLGRIISAPLNVETGGGCSLPTLTVCGNWNRTGLSKTSGDGPGTALKTLPTLLASDATRNSPNAKDSKGRKKLPAAIAALPSLTASDAAGGPGTSEKRKGGMNLRTAIKTLPSLCETDYKAPYSEEGYTDFISKAERIAAAGDGQIPLQAAVAWCLLAQ